jgi:hypothetical protein
VTFVFQQNTPLLTIDTDIGAVGQAGFAGYDTTDGKYRVTGSGSDIWGAADSFHFHAIDLYNQYGVATVKVDSIGDTHTFAKAGLMLRGGLAPEDPHILLDVRPNGGIEFMQRSAVGANTQFIAGGSTTFPVWLRLIHAPQTVTPQNVTAQISNDGTNWQTIGSTASQCCWLAGLAVTSHDNSALAQGVFEFPQLDIDWPARDYEVSDTGQQGYAWRFNGRYTVVGGGADIWGTRDTYNYLPLGGPSGLVARVLSLENTNTYAKAGVRMDLTDGHNVILDVRPTGDIEFMARPSSGAAMQFIAGAVHTFPVWLKIVDSGGVVTGSMSSDGTAWTEVGSVTVGGAARLMTSLAVTSHDTSKYTTAVFDRVAGVDSSVSPPPPAPDIVVYANDVPAENIHGVFAKTSDSTSPGSIALTTPVGGAAQPNNPLASPADYVDVTFNANADVPYTIWIRVKAAANSKLSDSLWAQFSDAKLSGTLAYDIGGTSGLLVNLATDSTASSLHNWGWANGAYWLAQPATVSFNSAGPHTLRIQPREYGVMLDQIVLSPSRFFNAGAHCPNSCGGAPGPLSNDTTIVPKP